jgi:uncharacterized DUF497 family protein
LEYEWSAHKSATNLAERAFDFSFASLIFEGKIFQKVDDRRDYGEERFVAIGGGRWDHADVGLYRSGRRGWPSGPEDNFGAQE